LPWLFPNRRQMKPTPSHMHFMQSHSLPTGKLN
jgi:hypothetical protein